MSEPQSDGSSHEQQLNAILHDYLQAVDAGQAPDKEEVLRRHPDLADELAAFFADQDRMNRLAQQMRITNPTESPAPAPLVHYVGDYELLEEIARGGMGVVFKARQISLNRLVAVKMILSGRLAEPAEVERFRREAGAAAGLDHPNIVPIYEVGEHQGHHYYSMKLIEGDNLGAEMPHFTANHSAAALLLAKVARAVQHAHEHGILHRDLKPGNILLDAAKQPHVTDFGLARRLDESSSLSASGAVIGTVSYMAPEQAAAECRRLTAAADVYALGAVLYEMLTGRPPFRNPNVVQTLREVVERDPERPRKLNRRVPRDLEVICLKCLDKRPTRRYATAAELADDLERCAAGRPIQARTVGRMERLWLWRRRQPTAAALVAVLVLATVLSACVVGLWLQADAERKQALQQAEEQDHLRYLHRISEAGAFLRDDSLDEARDQLEGCALTNRPIEWRYLYARAAWPYDARAAWPYVAWNFEPSGVAAKAGSRPPPVRQVRFAADGSRVVLLFDDELRVVRASDDQVVRSFRGSIGDVPLRSITSMSIDRDGSHVGLANHELMGVWSLETGAQVFRPELPWPTASSPTCVGLSPDGQRFAACYSDPSGSATAVWHVRDGKTLFTNGTTNFESMAFSPDGSRLAAISRYRGEDTRLRSAVFDARTGEVLLREDPAGAWENLCYSADGRRILTWSSVQGGSTCLIDALTGKVQVRIHRTALAAAMTPDGQRVLLVGFPYQGLSPRGVNMAADGTFTLTLWIGDAPTGQEVANIPFGFQPSARGGCWATISPDGERFCVFNQDYLAWFQPVHPRHVLTRQDRSMRNSQDPSTFAWDTLAFSRDGRFIAAADLVSIGLYDAASVRRIRTFDVDIDHSMHADCMAFSPDGQTLLAGDATWGRLQCWDVATGKRLRSYEGHSQGGSRSAITAVAYSPDSRRFAIASRRFPSAGAGVDNLVTVWDVAGDAEVFRLPHDRPAQGVVYRPDGRRILTIETGDVRPPKVKEWDAATGTLLRESVIPAPEGGEASNFVALFYRGDSPCVVQQQAVPQGGEAKTVVWDVNAGRQICEVHAQSWMTAVSPDGKRLVTRNPDNGTTRVWDVETGRELLACKEHWLPPEVPFGRYRWKIAFSADGNRVFQCEDHLTVWDVSGAP